MDLEKIIAHCVVIKVTKCKNKDYWYSDLINQHLVAFGYDDDNDCIFCCHIDNKTDQVATIPFSDCEFIQGSLDSLWGMS